MLQYCDKCGHIWDEIDGYEEKFNECEICHNHLKIVPDEYFEDPDFKLLLTDEMEQKLINDLVLTSPNFDQYYFDHKDEIEEQIDMQFEAIFEHGKAIREGRDIGNKYGISCPYCHATNISKIGYFSRSLSTGLFGLGSKKIGKQWHCDHCGSDF